MGQKGKRIGKRAMGGLLDTTQELGKDKEINENPKMRVHDNNLLKKSGSKRNPAVMEENAGKSKAASFSARQYTRSKTPRLKWTPDLHLRFLQAVERLGGQERATPKLVLQLMNIKGLSLGHVKSHLQMFRSKKTNCFNGVTKELMDNALRYYNLKQLPLKQNYIRTVSPNLRDGDASRTNHLHQLCSLNKVKAAAMEFIRGGLISRCNLLKERKFRSKINHLVGSEKFFKHCVPDAKSTSKNLKTPQNNQANLGPPWGYHQIKQPKEATDGMDFSTYQDGSANQKFEDIQELEKNNNTNIDHDNDNNKNHLKRKASDEYLDLNLSLKFAAKHDAKDREVQPAESCLSLSLSSGMVSNVVKSEERGRVMKKGKTEHTNNIDLNL